MVKPLPIRKSSSFKDNDPAPLPPKSSEILFCLPIEYKSDITFITTFWLETRKRALSSKVSSEKAMYQRLQRLQQYLEKN